MCATKARVGFWSIWLWGNNIKCFQSMSTISSNMERSDVYLYQYKKHIKGSTMRATILSQAIILMAKGCIGA